MKHKIKPCLYCKNTYLNVNFITCRPAGYCKDECQKSGNGKQKRLGSFDRIEEAAKARKEAEIRYGFHENHGADV
jgi:hypothetical protein